MKVLLVTAQLVPDIGGIAQSTARLASGLGRQGNDVLVITKRQRDTRPVGMGAVTRRRLRGGIPVIEVPQAWAHPDGIGLGIERLVAETRRFQPDVVHAYSAYSAAPLAAILARRVARPLVVSCRGQDVTKTLLEHPDRLRFGAGVADRLTVVSPRLLDWLSLAGPLPPAEVVANGIDAAGSPPRREAVAATRTRLGLDPNMATIGVLADFRWKKGFDYLLDVVTRLRDGAGPPLQLLFMGRFSAPAATAVESLARPGRLRCVTLSQPPPGRRRSLLHALDLFLVTSYREGMPNTLLEAMEAGTAVAATAVEGCADLLAGGQVGLALDPWNPVTAAREIAALLDDPDRRGRFAAAARRRVLGDYSSSTELAAVLRVYGGLTAMAAEAGH